MTPGAYPVGNTTALSFTPACFREVASARLEPLSIAAQIALTPLDLAVSAAMVKSTPPNGTEVSTTPVLPPA